VDEVSWQWQWQIAPIFSVGEMVIKNPEDVTFGVFRDFYCGYRFLVTSENLPVPIQHLQICKSANPI